MVLGCDDCNILVQACLTYIKLTSLKLGLAQLCPVGVLCSKQKVPSQALHLKGKKSEEEQNRDNRRQR